MSAPGSRAGAAVALGGFDQTRGEEDFITNRIVVLDSD